MMIPLRITVLVAMFAGITEAALMRGYAETDARYPGMCWVADIWEAIPPGGEWQLQNVCGKRICEKEGSDLTFTEETCGKVSAGSGCRLVQNLRKPYPDCCPQIKCS
ncbi:hypothetical protein SK128_024002 [Halocaridina rubra]|uniref:Single domain-containing protein n=1 Tax=Halocaridina rubra TaxID=373956 RepID=A0AAN8XPW2_HALRR